MQLPSDALFALAIPIPPLAEQHRIVAKVEELMAACDALEQGIVAVRAERLLDAVLHEASAMPEFLVAAG